uniref:Probable acetate kinase n=1 Tax=Leptocylindrus danicus TaxID=163516 RepID=A0A7S2PEI3_9STRA|mmetsp:Transcript_29793/g.43709  ORF Transcript_29793/g.43709 Transcript_29793/m.43709 type:complete len:462 (+) Transcript_29793:51-1436(+)
MKTVLAINSGSSSLKATLLQSTVKNGSNEGSSTARLLLAHAERLGTPQSFITVKTAAIAPERPKALPLSQTSRSLSNIIIEDTADSNDGNNQHEHFTKRRIEEANMTHKDALLHILSEIRQRGDWMDSIVAVGHRVVHGGTKFTQSTIVDKDTLLGIESVSHLAPLHNPANLEGIRILMEELPNVPSVAVFDTSFHTTMPPRAYTYPLPKQYREELEVRKYGFHGTSVNYVMKKAEGMIMLARSAGSISRNNGSGIDACGGSKMIIAHLGNGASVTAVANGKSVDTTMGFTPLEGLMMGTRCGSVDPAIVAYVAKQKNISADQVTTELNKSSGLKGITEGTIDMRCVLDAATKGDAKYQLALDMFVYILAKQIAGMAIACGGFIDALVFTAGIGENSAIIRSRTVELIATMLNLKLDSEKNECTNEGIISTDSEKRPLILVVPTDEEAMICSECMRLVGDM